MRTRCDDARVTVCVGCADEDGDFDSFKKRLGHQHPQPVEKPAVPSQLHYDSPHCRTDFNQPMMDIRYDDYIMQLDLSVADEAGA